MNKSHDYRALEREFITSQISLRELCRRHGISAHSLVSVQAKKGKWQEKREAYQQKAGDAFIEKHAARHADRLAQIEDKALDAIDLALDRFRDDMRATEQKLVNGEWVEVPVSRLMPKVVSILLDRLMVPFDRPSRIHEGRDLTVRSELPIDALNPLPRRRRLDD